MTMPIFRRDEYECEDEIDTKEHLKLEKTSNITPCFLSICFYGEACKWQISLDEDI
jgi:hypothetical protein